MKPRMLVSLSVAILALTGLVLAQNSSGTGEKASLADLARQQRAKRMKVMQERSVRIWTNDNMPKQPPSTGPTAAAGMSAAPSAPATEPGQTESSTASSSQAAGTSEAAGAEPSSSEGEHDEEYYRERMSELRAQLDMHQRQLSVLLQKQSQGQMQYYTDPQKTLEQEYSRSDINERNDEIAKKRQQIAEDEQAVRALQDQLRREGHPPGWLR